MVAGLKQFKIGNIVIAFVFVLVMNVTTFWDLAIIIFPNFAVHSLPCGSALKVIITIIKSKFFTIKILNFHAASSLSI